MYAHFHHFLSGSDLSPQPKWRHDWFSRFCTAHDSVVGHARACPFPLNITPSHGGSGPLPVHAFLGPSESITQTASWSVQPLLHSSWRSVIGDVGACPSPSKLPLSMGDLKPHLTRGSLGPPNLSSQMASWAGQPFMHSSWQTVPILYGGTPFPQKLPIPMGIWTPV